ncbi:hypothetical protein SCHPADRAFT_866880 [Schizopora paradoxa]|uniref:Nitrogen permease regulator 3 n=1 Tax=Schizopora paradoxa TaxID=27342 RepID=A0A0H2S969_9AGAM|nr:hypothetical protein SCHPADRAFT_866880 [Schizopora paradoxa]
MSETLLAILFVTSSSKGTNLVFHWPPFPSLSSRLARPKPQPELDIENVWLAATNKDPETVKKGVVDIDEWEYEWKRPSTVQTRSRSRSFANPQGRSRPTSRRASPSKDGDISHQSISLEEAEYSNLLGYSAEFLAGILSPTDNICHQKFDLVVDDLAFIGHPVCADTDGSWKFKEDTFPDRSRRGRGSRAGSGRDTDTAHISPITAEFPKAILDRQSGLQTFHLVLVLDVPDPSSSASGNLFKYFHVLYEQIAFTVTAMLYQEQVLHRYVDSECDVLIRLREIAMNKGTSFSEFVGQALDDSSLARAIKALHDSIKSNTIARLVINNVGIEVQLPPQLDKLLHPEDDNPDYVEHAGPVEVSWGPELHFGWSLPGLAPWKSLLLFDLDEEHNELKRNLNQPGMTPKDQMLAEGLIQFLETVSIFDSLATVAHSLDWDLETQVYPTVRWLVYHRRAKIVDTVHRGLRTVFALPSKTERSLPDLTAEFARAFPQPVIPPLPKLFATISNPSNSATTPAATSPSYNPVSTSLQTGIQLEAPHFFATVVKSKDLIPLYQDVVIWLLRHDALVTLHLRIRLVATAKIKSRARQAMDHAAKRRANRRLSSAEDAAGLEDPEELNGTHHSRSFSRRTSGATHTLNDQFGDDKDSDALLISESSSFRQRRYSSRSNKSDLVGMVIPEEKDNYDGDSDGVDLDGDGDESESGDGATFGEIEDDLLPSIIRDPGMATPLQRKWIKAMSEGKSEEIKRRFEAVNQYFDGKRTDDEILHKADISRKQLREVLHHYEEHASPIPIFQSFRLI